MQDLINEYGTTGLVALGFGFGSIFWGFVAFVIFRKG